MMQKTNNNTVKKLRHYKNTGRKFENLPVLIFYKERMIFMSEKVKATIRNEKDERHVEFTPEMEAELSNGNGGEE